MGTSVHGIYGNTVRILYNVSMRIVAPPAIMTNIVPKENHKEITSSHTFLWSFRATRLTHAPTERQHVSNRWGGIYRGGGTTDSTASARYESGKSSTRLAKAMISY